MSDPNEDVIKRRLLIDGDGTGDDRRLFALMKTFNKWCQNPTYDQVTHDKMLAQLAQCEFAMKKSQLATKMSDKELNNYEKITKNIEANIESIKESIKQNKLELKNAKTVRKNKMEYDILAQLISEQSDRKQTLQRLNELKNELSTLEQKSCKLEEKLDMRRKQFHVLISSANYLQGMLEENDYDNETNSSLNDQVTDEEVIMQETSVVPIMID